MQILNRCLFELKEVPAPFLQLLRNQKCLEVRAKTTTGLCAMECQPDNHTSITVLLMEGSLRLMKRLALNAKQIG
jgi:hypothetical protein